jgi:pSer/pThr/pTyr-binding forkhead associated (FHA) protein
VVQGAVEVLSWFREQWLHIFLAAVFAIVVGVMLHCIFYKKTAKSKILEKTILRESKKILSKIILPNNSEIKITEKETVLGREDFIGAVPSSDLLLIGRKHFKILKMDNGMYVEDLNTINGTKLNGNDIKGAGRKKLKNGDEILVAGVLKVRYVEETS